ncbi:MAG TPA: HAD-IG family 5'-nucleotidase [bacterium]|nr:HAD-IG family 5'-nucleotidase [bacterium]
MNSKLIAEFLEGIKNGTEPLSDFKQSIPKSRDVFVNRNLRMRNIKMIGFDMDYTLADYEREAFEELAFNITVEKLIKKRGYPEEIRSIRYKPRAVIRGLVVDKKRGNILKVDAFQYVARAVHGKQLLTKDERRSLYASSKMNLSDANFVSVDTMFSLPEVYLYAELVQFFDRAAEPNRLRAVSANEPPPPRPVPMGAVLSAEGKVDYGKIFDDLRAMLDEAHADNSLKSVVLQDLPRYIRKDPRLAVTLYNFRMNGKKLFLLTNSEWYYTDAVMKHLLDGELAEMPRWRDFFDVVIVSSKKPGWFKNGHPFLRIDDERSGASSEATEPSFQPGKVYERGNLNDFERMAGARGDEIFYVGDHIYGDILRSKKDSLWRTCMIVSELEEELAKTEALLPRIEKLEKLKKEKNTLDLKESTTLERIDKLRQFKIHNFDQLSKQDLRLIDEEITRALEYMNKITGNLTDILVKIKKLEQGIDQSYNDVWGELFREGTENTRFADQIKDYACVYTSRVSNFSSYSPTRYFQSPKDMMPHEL